MVKRTFVLSTCSSNQIFNVHIEKKIPYYTQPYGMDLIFDGQIIIAQFICTLHLSARYDRIVCNVLYSRFVYIAKLHNRVIANTHR